MSNDKRILGITFNGKVLFDPYPSTSSIIYGATGAAKTTSVVVPAVESLLSNNKLALIINDVKDGEIAAQIGECCQKYNRRFGVLDDFKVLGEDYPYRLSLNPFGSIVSTHKKNPTDVLYAIEAASQALIPEPQNDSKNQYFRDVPREEIDLGVRILLSHRPDMVTPGGLNALMGDPEVWTSAVNIAAEEGDPALMARAQQSIAMRENDPEHYFQHSRAAVTSLRMYEPNSTLHHAGFDADITHEQILKGSYVFCLVQPQQHTARLGSHYALHFNSFMDAQLTGNSGNALYILDELCNAPLKPAVERVTIQRSYGGRSLYIAQSRADIERKYGVKETTILEENCPVIQWLSFTSFSEAERVSKAMGEQQNVSQSIGFNSDKLNFSNNINTGKERLFAPDELMNLNPDEQIIFIKSVGFIHCRKLFQNEIAPYCYDLADNPLEGGRLKPNPKITLSTGGQS
ncbi:MAG: type IV secretory system conjugative DNA transfer family protein [Hyphomicrobiales bacterium]